MDIQDQATGLTFSAELAEEPVHSITDAEAAEAANTDNQPPAEEQAPAEPGNNEAEEGEAGRQDNDEGKETTRRQYASKAEVLERVREIAHSDEPLSRDEIDHLKTAFYRMHGTEREAQRRAFIEAGGEIEKYEVARDELEEAFKAEMGVIKEKRAQLYRLLEAEKAANLKRKLDIIDQVKAMITSPDEVNKSFQTFKALQQEWRDIKAVPAERSSELWRTYQHYVEQYYDLVKLNNEAREYDFKKNLEIKTRLCETAEKLDEEADVISAFHQLQELHQQFREVGPVAKELREEIWQRFKAASTVINKKHQQYFEGLRAQEEDNLAKKTVLCQKVEAILQTPIKQSSGWEKYTKEITDIQAEWKTIGFAPQKMNVKIFERFRAACDTFFRNKTAFFKEMKKLYSENIAKKKELVEKAQALKDSEEWKNTADQLIALQKEWKTVGIVPKKVGDQLWADFQTACNHFFDARNQATSGQRNEENKNLELKQDIIGKLRQLLETEDGDIQQQAQALAEEYQKVGHVPFRMKDKLYAEYREVTDELNRRHNIQFNRQRLDNFRNSLKNVARRGEEAVDNERSRLMRQYESLKQEIQTYENNLGFLNISSKNGNSLLTDMNNKVERLKENLQLVKDKIKTIDEATKEEKHEEAE